jgi:membrane-associated phospholipid phosphatase
LQPTMNDKTAAPEISATLRRSNPIKTVSLNLALMRMRKKRIGGQTSISWWPIFELVLVISALVVCSFVLLDRSVALQRGSLPEWLGPFSQFITRFGKADWILYPSGFALIALVFVSARALSKKTRFRIFRWNLWLSFVFLGVGVPYLISTILKLAIGRPRPSQFADFGLYDFHPFAFNAVFASFPSGHATIIGAFAVVMSMLVPKWRALFAIIAVMIGFSRVAVGAHHPSDVISGLAIGAILAFLVAKWFAARGLLFLSVRRNWPELRPSMRPFSRARL